MTEPQIIYKKRVNQKSRRTSVVRKKPGSKDIIDKRPKLQKDQKFDRGPKFRWQKINGKVRCPKCEIIYQIGNIIEFRCPWCGRLLWLDHSIQNEIYMRESD